MSKIAGPFSKDGNLLKIGAFSAENGDGDIKPSYKLNWALLAWLKTPLGRAWLKENGVVK